MKRLLSLIASATVACYAGADTPYEKLPIVTTAAGAAGAVGECDIPEQGADVSIWDQGFTEHSPARGRHSLTERHDGEYVLREIPGRGAHGPAHEAAVREWRWDGGNGLSGLRPTIIIQLQEHEKADSLGLKRVEMLDGELRRIPAIILYSLPSEMRILIWFGDDPEAYASLTVSKSPDNWRFDTHYAVVLNGHDDRYSEEGSQRHGYEELLIHEFAHVIDFHWGVTDILHRDFWESQQEKRGGDLTRFVSKKAGTEVRENFAETLKFWAVYYAGLTYDTRQGTHVVSPPHRLVEHYYDCTPKEFRDQTALEETEWWQWEAIKASDGFSGRLFGDQAHAASRNE